MTSIGRSTRRSRTTPPPRSRSSSIAGRSARATRSVPRAARRSPTRGCTRTISPRPAWSADRPRPASVLRLAAALEQLDRLPEHVGGGSLDVLAPVLLLGGQPGLVVLDGEAHDPLVAEVLLELVHLLLEHGHGVLASAFALALGLGILVLVVEILVLVL